MQTPDFWSIPFAPPEPASAPAPPSLGAVPRALLGPVPALDGPLEYDVELARLVDAHLDGGRLRPADRARAGRALTAL